MNDNIVYHNLKGKHENRTYATAFAVNAHCISTLNSPYPFPLDSMTFIPYFLPQIVLIYLN